MSILTADEAATYVRCEPNDQKLLALLPQVDAYIERATGRDWGQDSEIDAGAKSAARMLIVRAYEDPGALTNQANGISFGLPAVLLQLEARAHDFER
ncbi:MAG: hypothetical protein KBA03_00760 [Anaerolineaceae bacterium]|nr:hypothetical protein [Anaerolineaceae bacterium]